MQEPLPPDDIKELYTSTRSKKPMFKYSTEDTDGTERIKHAQDAAIEVNPRSSPKNQER